MGHHRRIPQHAIRVALPGVSQEQDYTCGPAALLAICRHFGVGPTSEAELEREMGIDRTGSDPEHLVRAARRHGLQVDEYDRDMTAAQLRDCLQRRRPVLMMLQAWAEPRPSSYRRVWRHGHWVVAIGFDDDGVYLEDPALRDARGFLSWAELDERWHDVGPGRTRIERYGAALWRPRARRRGNVEAMTRALLLGMLLIGALGCQRGAPPPATPAPDPAPAATRLADAAPAPAPVVAVAVAAWPYRAWDRAEAVRFNDLPYGPDIPLRVYDAEHGWSPHIVERAPLSLAQGEAAVARTLELGGEALVSQCPFPRHAVVLHAGDEPVATINVCFDCGDILVWPPVEPAREAREWTAAELAAYEAVFARWRQFFADELGYPIDSPHRQGR